MIKISPSILACDFSHLSEEIKRVDKFSDYLHVDVMDGEFVPNISFGMPVIKSIRGVSDIIFDVHLMIDRPERYIEEFVKVGSDIITIHFESTKDPAAALKMIKSYGKKAGISIKPGTDVKVLLPLLPLCDLVLIMTVEPGFGGQKFMEDMMGKVSYLREIINREKYDIEIEVDGGINDKTAAVCAAAGANVLVAGSSVFSASDAEKAIFDIRASAENALDNSGI
ncbi:MAG: ribulose-phosphate 3-epimerase [Eubacteriales bacterium]